MLSGLCWTLKRLAEAEAVSHNKPVQSEQVILTFAVRVGRRSTSSACEMAATQGARTRNSHTLRLHRINAWNGKGGTFSVTVFPVV